MSYNQDHLHNFDAISISLASPDQILSWSHGEVKKPETINYRTQKPEREGLFCERIFGPTKNYECYCGKYKRIRYKGVICEKCGVEVTKSAVRRERMGHIKLAVPVTHIWYLRSTPSRLGLILNQPIKSLEQVVYFAAYIVTNLKSDAQKDTLEQLETEYQSYRNKISEEYKAEKAAIKNISEAQESKLETKFSQKIDALDEQHKQAKEDLKKLEIGSVLSELQYRNMSLKFGHVFTASTGAEAIEDIVSNLNLNQLLEQLAEQSTKSSGQKLKKIEKRINFIKNLIKSGNNPSWMIIKALPVSPPDLRPMVQLDGGRFAASDLNDLYRRVINRNNRLKKLLSIGAPEVICRNEKRMLQEAVDTLINISARQSRTSYNAGDKRKLKSLSDFLKGKQGRFRQNLLGKRVDYSGRSVIVVGPKLKLDECGLPKQMALTLFKPFVLSRLIRDGYAHNIKSAEKLILANRKEVWDILEEVTTNKHVLLNRAPTLHRLGIQAFKPKLIEGKAIQIHPLVCAAFNADFDGDQMAVHLPLSEPAQKEAAELIQSAKNLLKPSAGEPIVDPSQDMILGAYYLTKETKGQMGENSVYSNLNELNAALELKKLHLQSQIRFHTGQKIIQTTPGRVIFNQILPKELQFLNKTMTKSDLSQLIMDSFNLYDLETTAKLCDDLKDIGFKYATLSGISLSAADMPTPKEKLQIIEKGNELVKEISNQCWRGLLTEEERYSQTIKVWNSAKTEITEIMVGLVDEENDLHYMINSGARGNWGQITQLCGMKGLVTNPAGRTIELPIKSNLIEGYTILEYFIASHSGRKGKSDTALKTAEAGYLTRRLVDAVQDLIVRDHDCETKNSHIITKASSENIGLDFTHRIFGRHIAEKVTSTETGKTLISKGTIINHAEVEMIKENSIAEIKVYSPLTCKTEGGVCQKCYGFDLGTNDLVQLGTPVGIIAAQSIGEPGTQLTMRTFHMGGVQQESDITQGLSRVDEILEAKNPKSPAILSGIDGVVKVKTKGRNTEIEIDSQTTVQITYNLEENFLPVIKKGEEIKEKQIIAKSSVNNNVIRAQEAGKIKELNNFSIVVETLDAIQKLYLVPKGKSVKVKNGQNVSKGDNLTSGSINLRELMSLTDEYTTLKYIIEEVQSIYAMQGQNINDKHIEMIAHQMVSRIRIQDSGDSNLTTGQISNKIKVDNINKVLEKDGKKLVKYEKTLMGLIPIALSTDSWLSSASFQETIKVLVDAATTKRIDKLEGLKENVIIGKLIPAGETYRKNQSLNK